MASLEEIRSSRLAKVEALQKLNINPYPPKVPVTLSGSDFKKNFEQILSGQSLESIAGRIMAIRGQGAILFVVIYDGTENVQAVFKKDEMNEEAFGLFTAVSDIGDFISVTGKAFITQKGEPSLLAKEWVMASKSLRPLPDKFHGLKDEETRLRQRYLDILTNPELKDMFLKKAKFWQVTRRFLEDKGFIAVQTPTLEVTTGGAEAEPFTTHHNDYDLDVYLRISVGELWQKRLMAAGFSKTYEIGRVYRNEGSSPDHLQEFTNMEFYWAYADFKMGMQLVQELYQTLAREVFNKTSFSSRGHSFDLAGDWDVIDYRTTILNVTGIDILNTTEDVMREHLASKGVNHNAESFERVVDVLWKQCRKTISGPVFVTGYPDFMQPLAKRDPDNPATVQQFQVLIAGSEIGKGYSELNDPTDQRERFEAQQKLREAGDMEAMMPDYEFLEMLEHGMPPTCGFGFGERLFAFLVDKPVRETQLFPLVKPKQ